VAAGEDEEEALSWCGGAIPVVFSHRSTREVQSAGDDSGEQLDGTRLGGLGLSALHTREKVFGGH
jgi:hypothetical protein